MIVRSRLALLCCCALLLATTRSAAAGEAPQREQMMVLDLAAQGVDAKLARSLTQTVTTTLGQRGDFSVISQEEMQTMLGFEERKQLMGCVDEVSCLAEITGAMGARFLVKGAVSQVGQRWFLTLVRIDVQQARVIARFREAVGDERLLDDLAVKAANAVMGLGTAAAGATGILMVKTEPPGAAVRVDGRDVGVAPVVVKELFTGQHLVEASKGELKRSLAVEVRPGQVARAFLELVAGKLRSVTVFSKPPEAAVSWDGEPVGVTPVVVRDVTSGPHRLALSLQGYLAHEERLEVTGDRELNVKLLPAMRRVTIATRPPGAEVTLAGEALGPAPVEASLQAGASHALAARAPGYEPFSREVRVVPAAADAGPQEVVLELVPAPVELELVVSPDKGRVLIGEGEDRQEQVGSGRVRVVPGTRKVVASLDGYRTVEKQVELAVGRPARLELVLQPYPALLEYEAGLKRKRWLAWGTLSLAVLAGAAIGPLYKFSADAADESDEAYGRHKQALDADAARRALDEAREADERSQGLQVGMYVSAAVAAAALGLSIYGFATMPERPTSWEVAPALAPDGRGGRLVLTGRF